MENTLRNESRQRPIGVTILAILLGIEGLFEVVLGVIAIIGLSALGRVAAAHGHTVTKTTIDIFGGVLGGASLVIGILTLIFVVGLWLLKRWAFWLTIIIEVISLLRHAIEFIRPHTSTVSIVVGMILPAIILIYFLLDANVRRAFRV